MDEQRSIHDLVWDYGVYAPIGLAVSILEELPRLSERLSDKGKERAAGQVNLAKVIGEMAVVQGRRQLGKFFGETLSRPAPAAGGEAGSSNGSSEMTAAAGEGQATTAAPGELASPSADSLAIPAYDTLAASQVVQRLSSLRPDELEDVRRYELSTRARRTILDEIDQLAAGQ